MKYDFVEIGTSDFETEIEKADDSTVGLSVEPLSIYYNNLPNKKNCKKVMKAISNKEGTVSIYYIKPETINENGLPYWVKGCNSITNPRKLYSKHVHFSADDYFREDIVSTEKVECITPKTLFLENNVTSIGLLKIDTEGHDGIILKEIINVMKENTKFIIDKIQYELTYIEEKEISEINQLLEDMDYEVLSKGSDLVYKKK